jgi:hypothetical protein
MATDAELLADAEIISNETELGANTASRVGSMFSDIIASKRNILNPAVYRAVIVQASTGNPTATVIENEIGFITFSRSGVGVYSIDSSPALFTADMTFVTPQYSTIRIAANYTSIVVELNTTSAISIQTYINGVASDDVLDNFPIEILVYP